MKLKLLEHENVLLKKKSVLQNESFSISELQDTKPSSLLYRLGDKVQKKDFSSIKVGDEGSLDSLCKVFAISHPYSAIGLVDNTIYISLSQEKKIDIPKIIDVTSKLVNSDLNSKSCIPHVAQFYNTLDQSGNQYVKKILDIKYSELDKELNHQDLCNYAAQDAKIFFQYFNKNDINNIKQLLNTGINFVQIIPKNDELHIHVELNLVATILEKHKVKDIHIGLSSSNARDEFGCCGYCVATLNSISDIESINIYRSKDFPQNIPFGHWDFPYKLLNTTTKSYVFFSNLFKQYIPIIQKNKGNEEAFVLLKEKLNNLKCIEDIQEISKQINVCDKEIADIPIENPMLLDKSTQTNITQEITIDTLAIMIMGDTSSLDTI